MTQHVHIPDGNLAFDDSKPERFEDPAARSSSDSSQCREEAMDLLQWFAGIIGFKHGVNNPYLTLLGSLRSIPLEKALAFLCAWYPVSRHQPQILLRCAAAFDDWEDRKWIIVRNYLEEDGLRKGGHQPHYWHLQRTIAKMGGGLEVNPETERMSIAFRESIGQISDNEAAGLIAGIEAPALDISAILHEIIGRAGFPELLETDFYLRIHVKVEPEHVLDSHKSARLRMKAGLAEREQVLAGYKRAITFWDEFWPVAFQTIINFH
jgi:hypothetical protein